MPFLYGLICRVTALADPHGGGNRPSRAQPPRVRSEILRRKQPQCRLVPNRDLLEDQAVSLRGDSPCSARIAATRHGGQQFVRWLRRRSRSIPRFFLMPEGQHVDGIVCRFVPIQGHIARVAERNGQLAPRRVFRKRAANSRRRLQRQKSLLNSLSRPPNGRLALVGQKVPAAFQSLTGAGRDNYVWHSGSPVSSSVPHVFSQVRTSSPVRCRPVSW